MVRIGYPLLGDYGQVSESSSSSLNSSRTRSKYWLMRSAIASNSSLVTDSFGLSLLVIGRMSRWSFEGLVVVFFDYKSSWTRHGGCHRTAGELVAGSGAGVSGVRRLHGKRGCTGWAEVKDVQEGSCSADSSI